MAYDVDRRAGEWARARGASLFRSGILLLSAAVVASLAAALVSWRLGNEPVAVVVALLGLASGLVLNRAGERVADASTSWIQGGAAELHVGELLDELRRDGFYVLHDVAKDRDGNVDHIVCGPSGVYVVETKRRRYELPHLARTKRLARWLHDELGVWVTPVICLATRDDPPAKRQGVWVMGRRHLLGWLRAQRNQPVAFERLARFADTLE